MIIFILLNLLKKEVRAIILILGTELVLNCHLSFNTATFLKNEELFPEVLSPVFSSLIILSSG